MGRLNYNLKHLNDALQHVENIIIKKVYHRQLHNPHKRAHENLIEFSNEVNILKDFMLFYNSSRKFSQLNEATNSTNKLPLLSLPVVDLTSITVNLNPIDNSALKLGSTLANNDISNDISQQEHGGGGVDKLKLNKLSNECTEMWQKFEETLYIKAFSSLPILFKPQINFLSNNTDNKHMPKVVVDEWISVAFDIKNSLRISLILYNVTLLWKIVETSDPSDKVGNSEITNETTDLKEDAQHSLVEFSTIKELTLNSFETFKLRLRIKTKKPHVHLHILGIKYLISLENVKFHLTTNETEEAVVNGKEIILGKQLFDLKGHRLNNNQQAMRSIAYDIDNRLNLKIINKAPLMQV
jgi:hypothetical protein